MVLGTVRDPAIGNLPIILISGNAVCTNSGGVCNAATGANCVFPCLVGPSGKACGDAGSGLSLPGTAREGLVRVADRNIYTILASNVGNLPNTFSFAQRDLCDSGCSDCPGNDDIVTASSGTFVPNCNDNDTCTTDCCSAGICSHTSDCITVNACRGTDGVVRNVPPISCDDQDACTTDVCVNDKNPATACCSHTPVVCPDDGNACTQEICSKTTGSCQHVCATPGIICPPDKSCECDDAPCRITDPQAIDDCSVHPVVHCDDVTTPGKFPQDYTIDRTCKITNDCGNTASCTQRISVVDTEPPIITCPPDKDCECGQPCDLGQPTVTDNCDPSPIVTVEVQEIPGNCLAAVVVAGITPPPKLTVKRTYTATDGAVALAVASGQPNSTQCIQTVKYFDTTAPVIGTCKPDFSVCAGGTIEFTPPSCTDLCGSCTMNCVRSDGQPLDAPAPSQASTLTITCQATDECRNHSSCNTDVTVNDSGCTSVPTVSAWGATIICLLLLIGARLRFSKPMGKL
ncbi:MAG: hypothetical protein HYR83_03390 [Planctomycetes bacterium]|nr:hypothetical protein [Planctomycetota bacterium]